MANHFYAKGLEPIECLKRAEIFAAYKIGFDGASVGFCDEEMVETLVKKHLKNNLTMSFVKMFLCI